MSTETAQADALDMLRAGLTPDPSQIAAKHNTSLYGAESAIYAAMDYLAARMARSVPKPPRIERPGFKVSQKRMAEERGAAQARAISRTEAQR